MPDTPKIYKGKVDTLTINSKAYTDALKKKDTFIALTYQQDKTPASVQSFWDYGAVKLLLPVAVTLFIFWLGQKFNSFNKKNDKRTILENAKQSLEVWVLQLERSVLLLHGYHQVFLKGLKEQDSLAIIPMHHMPTLIYKVSEIKLEEFHSYTSLNLEGDKTENAKKGYLILQYLEIIKGLEKAIYEHYKNYRTQMLNVINVWNKENGLFYELILEMMQDVHSNKGHVAQKFSNEISAIAPSSAQEKITKWLNGFGDELANKMYRELSDNPTNPYTLKLLTPVMKLRNNFSEYKALRSDFATIITQDSKSFKDAYDELKKEIQQLQLKNIRKSKDIK